MVEQEESGVAAAEAAPREKLKDAAVVRKAKRAARWQGLRMQQLVWPVGQEPGVRGMKGADGNRTGRSAIGGGGCRGWLNSLSLKAFKGKGA